MKLFGRITVFGEHLMHEHSEGLVVPSKAFLATEGSDDNLHPDYRPECDDVLKLLGMGASGPLYGNLPLGHGFSASTVLCFLHLRDSSPTARARAMEVDATIHGFPPSGLDVACCEHQSSGFYRALSWRSAPPVALRRSALLVPKERQRSVREVHGLVLAHAPTLVPIAERISARLLDDGVMAYQELYHYAVALHRTGAYSARAAAAARVGLAHGAAVKAVGGLYDKALVIFWSDNVSELYRQRVRAAMCRDDEVWIDDI